MVRRRAQKDSAPQPPAAIEMRNAHQWMVVEVNGGRASAARSGSGRAVERQRSGSAWLQMAQLFSVIQSKVPSLSSYPGNR